MVVEPARPRLSLAAIAEAAVTIDPSFVGTPLLEDPALNGELGCRLHLKVETDNPIRSFKGRGADFFLSAVMARDDLRPMVCASTGNFGQAMAYACEKHDRALTVFADERANQVKIERIGHLGAEVRLAGDDFDAAKEAARRYADRHGSWMVEDGREPEISEGAGSIGVELTGTGMNFDVALVPVGNGALIGGVARWLKTHSPSTQIVGVSARGADAMERSWRTGRLVHRKTTDTIAEGIAVRVPVPEAVTDMVGIVDDVVLVDDRQLIEAMRILYVTTGQIVEPSAAAGVAAIMASPRRYRGANATTILTGANLTPAQMQTWLGLPL